jgi:hypothetical protein
LLVGCSRPDQVIDMLVPFAAVAVLLLIGIAVRVGGLQAQHQAWDRIAAERRRLAERSRALDEQEVALSLWESELVHAADSGACLTCPLRRGRGERPTGT